jgi:2'-hydroxyisoflavone reductase
MLAAARAGADSMLRQADTRLDMLVLGGTGFIGPHQINHALDRGHRVTMFNRGTRSGMYGDRVEELSGDRDTRVGDGLRALDGDRRWDVVIDNSGYVPRHVRDSAEMLVDRCDMYLFTSTVSVYDFEKAPVVDRDGPLLPAPDPVTEDVTGESYGPLKAECDRIVQEVCGDKATIVRPTYVVGPGDSTDRFTYWVERLHRGGDVVCPAHPDFAAQWIDVRDLAQFFVRLAEDGTFGAFNGVGPASRMSNEQFIHGLRAFAAAPTQLHWPTAELLAELDYPTPMFWAEDLDLYVDASAAVEAGLTYRSLAETVRDTHEWWETQPAERRANPRRWPTAEQEAAVLARLEA